MYGINVRLTLLQSPSTNVFTCPNGEYEFPWMVPSKNRSLTVIALPEKVCKGQPAWERSPPQKQVDGSVQQVPRSYFNSAWNE